MGATAQHEVAFRAISLVEMLSPHSALTLQDICEEFEVTQRAAERIVEYARRMGFFVVAVALPGKEKPVYRIGPQDLKRIRALALKRTAENVRGERAA